uniref:Replication initiator protein n=1 Tax=Dulem virus 172 TaxID=3145649 RepID=A0AAU8AWW4_9VIRU
MTCYHPLKGFPIGLTEKGKAKMKICSYKTDFVRFDGQHWHCHSGVPPFGDYVSEFTEIPCGQCIGCRLDYSRQWANRCMLEASEHSSSFFLTLTYDDDHLPANEIINVTTGEIKQSPVHTLVKKDLSGFMKRLRKNTGQKLRFYGCGEYGGETFRPHYHVIVFGLELDDLQIYKRSTAGFWYYNSETVQKCWKNGFVVVCDVSWDTCAYTARYVTKKLKGEPAQIYEEFNLVPPFVNMSRKPGIARNYYEQNKDKIYKYDCINLMTEDGGRQFKPP